MNILKITFVQHVKYFWIHKTSNQHTNDMAAQETSTSPPRGHRHIFVFDECECETPHVHKGTCTNPKSCKCQPNTHCRGWLETNRVRVESAEAEIERMSEEISRCSTSSQALEIERKRADEQYSLFSEQRIEIEKQMLELTLRLDPIIAGLKKQESILTHCDEQKKRNTAEIERLRRCLGDLRASIPTFDDISGMLATIGVGRRAMAVANAAITANGPDTSNDAQIARHLAAADSELHQAQSDFGAHMASHHARFRDDGLP